ncbi:bifunctional adenosylcobinamide kinase/adenosylcobinamide-phosphate guanylyltransferase [Paenibacillus motobuensis]|uniref:Adenosylcobinamide kinase n=1 Tax=Paenibacillus motobuensis TaxID=295324 RepID=A0ABN0Y544_9BACL
MIITVTGGARSGKSSFAEKWCMKHAERGIYIATAQAFDDEMRQRIRLHQSVRVDSGFPWETKEEPLRLAALLSELAQSNNRISSSIEEPVADEPVVLVDCLTLWLSNILLASGEGPEAEQQVLDEIERLAAVVSAYSGNLVLVTNEVGDGIVPEYRLGRVYRDLSGIMNRKMAEISQQVFLVTVGIPIELKSREYRL